MGLSISPVQRLSALPEFRYKRAYLEKSKKVIDSNFKAMTPIESELLRAMVFPVDRSWPPANQLPARFAKAVDTLLGNQKSIKYFEESRVKIGEKLKEWNDFAHLPKPEFARKVEGSGHLTGIEMRIIKPYGISYYDFVDFCRIYEKIPVYKCVKDTLVMMHKKKWTGIVTPRVCTFLLSGMEIPVLEGSKLKELEIG